MLLIFVYSSGYTKGQKSTENINREAESLMTKGVDRIAQRAQDKTNRYSIAGTITELLEDKIIIQDRRSKSTIVKLNGDVKVIKSGQADEASTKDLAKDQSVIVSGSKNDQEFSVQTITIRTND